MSEKLEKLDAKILKFVYRNKEVSIEQISKHIKIDSNARVNNLISKKYLKRNLDRYESINCGIVKGVLPVYSKTVSISDSGKIAFQNHHEDVKSFVKNYFLNNWIAFLALAIAVISFIRTF